MKSFRKGDIFVSVTPIGPLFEVSIEIHKQVFEKKGNERELYSWALSFSKSIADFVLECLKRST